LFWLDRNATRLQAVWGLDRTEPQPVGANRARLDGEWRSG
jgi:hypothetical protein